MTKPSHKSGGLRLGIVNLYIRFFLFFVLGFVGLISAENWVWAGALAATGLFLDIIRWQVSPEINMSADQLSKALIDALKNRDIVGPRLRRQSLPFNAALTIGFLYVVCLSLIDTYASSTDLTPYLEFVAPLTELGYGIIELVRAYSTVLTGTDYEHRLLIVGHMYSFNFLFILLLTCISSFGYFYRQLFRGYIRIYNMTAIGLYKSPLNWSVSKHFWAFLFTLFLLLCSVVMQTSFNALGWQGRFGDGQWLEADSNLTFASQYLFSSGVFIGAWMSYYAALNLRASTASQHDLQFLDDPVNPIEGSWPMSVSRKSDELTTNRKILFIFMAAALLTTLVVLFTAIKTASANDVYTQVFKQCTYRVKNCVCCKQLDIIYGLYGTYGGDYVYIGEKRTDKEIVFVVHRRGEKAKLEGYPTYVIRKSKEDNKWREVLAGRSSGLVLWASYARHNGKQYFGGIYCLQTGSEEGYRYTYRGDRYEIIDELPVVPCIYYTDVKTLFDPQ
ncbi:MAG: hypothetical protein V7727_14135 [Sneathiella sp.]